MAAMVFRLTQFPHGHTLSELSLLLQDHVFNGQGVTLDMIQSTVCPSCVNSNSQVALLHFQPHPPEALQTLSDNESFPIRNWNTVMNIDKHFYGLTQLYPTTGEIKADIVAVPGLNGHAYGSWAGRPGPAGQKQMWLRHFLSDDLPNYRTMIYGYNSRLSSNSIHVIPDYTTAFLEELVKAREQSNEKTRPIIFIGHSFGGVIIAQAIVQAKDNDNRFSSLLASTKATMFFGTPHRGLVVDDILAIIGEDSPRRQLVLSLHTGADGLQRELGRFINISERLGLKIISFKETQRTRRFVQGNDNQWSREGEYHTAVGTESSILQLPASIEETLPVEGDHSTIAKLNSKGDPAYTSVLRHVKNATGILGGVRRSPSPSIPSHAHRPIHSQGRSSFSNLAYQAVVNKDTQILQQLLLENGELDVNHLVTYNGQETSLLHIASARGDDWTVQFLLAHGANIAAVTRSGSTALHEGASGGHQLVVQVLLSRGVDIDARRSDNWTALHVAANRGYERVAEMLLEGGAGVNARNNERWTALHLAARGGNDRVVKVLLRYRADTSARVAGGWSALLLAAASAHERVVEALLRHGADINAQTKQGWNSLHHAARNGHDRIVKQLLAHRADINARTPGNKTALDLAGEGGHARVETYLRKAQGPLTR